VPGRVCVVTGATSGLGLATARQLVDRGHSVAIVGRSAAKCADVAAQLAPRAAAGAAVDWLVADFADQSAVRRLAAEVERRHPRVDVLVNNAGATFRKRLMTREGVEMTLAVNHLAAFLLTTLLLDRLRANAPARIVNVASVGHEHGHVGFEDMAMDHGYRPVAAYNRSKLANVLFTYELARRLEGTGVTANAVHPGLVRTALGTHNGALRSAGWRLLLLAYGRKSLTPAQGADTVVYLAESDAVAGVSGRYFVNREPVPSSPASRDEATAQRLWDESERLTASSVGYGHPAPLAAPDV
jgi:NAD(P)-dependent dehydrogenase (short-subunit alcohol dehydrogenase family)